MAPAASAQGGDFGLICIGCGVFNTGKAIDGNEATAAQMHVTLGLLGGARLNVDSGQTFHGQNRAGFVLNPSAGALLSAGLLNQFTVALLNDGKLVASNKTSSLISLHLIGWPGSPQQFLYVDSDQSFDTVRLDMASAVGLFTDMNVYQACAGPSP